MENKRAPQEWSEVARKRALLDELILNIPHFEGMPPHDVRRAVVWMALHYTLDDDRRSLVADVLAQLQTEEAPH